MARGFGSTYGSGNTDKIVSAFTTGISAPRTYAIWAYSISAGGGLLGRMFDKSTTNGAHEALNINTTFNYAWTVQRSGGESQWTFGTPVSSQWRHFALTYDGANLDNTPGTYIDGSAVTPTLQISGSGTITGSSQGFSIGNRVSDSARCWDGMLADFAVWDVALDAAEIAALGKGASPLTIRLGKLLEYVPMTRANVSYKVAAPTVTGTAVQPHPRIIMPRSAKFRRFNRTTAKSIIASAGSYAITGTNASLLLKRKLAAGAGSYALTGTDAALRLGKKLAAGAGSYAVNGVDATLLHAWKVSLAAGSYTLTGTAATLLQARKIAAAAGAYALTGSDAGLITAAEKTLSAEAGSYAISGTSTALLHAWKATTVAGSFSISGTAAALAYGRKVAAGAGAYALTGVNAALIRGHPLAAAAGAYAVNGSAVNLTLLRKLIAQSGIYTIGGTDAALTRSAAALIADIIIALAAAEAEVTLDAAEAEVTLSAVDRIH